jgi:hypothetical protein
LPKIFKESFLLPAFYESLFDRRLSLLQVEFLLIPM